MYILYSRSRAVYITAVDMWQWKLRAPADNGNATPGGLSALSIVFYSRFSLITVRHSSNFYINAYRSHCMLNHVNTLRKSAVCSSESYDCLYPSVQCRTAKSLPIFPHTHTHTHAHAHAHTHTHTHTQHLFVYARWNGVELLVLWSDVVSHG